MTAASGLALSTAPDVAHYLPFLGSLSRNRLAAGVASVFAPAVAVIVFVFLALILINCKFRLSAESTTRSDLVA